MIYLITDSGDVQMKTGLLIFLIVLSAVFIIGFYLLRSFGLYNLAKHSKEKKIKKIAYFSFIPCLWIYIASKLAGKITMFGKEVKSYALILSIVYTVGELALVVFDVLCYAPVAIHFLNGGTLFINMSDTFIKDNVYLLDGAISFETAIYPYGSSLNGMITALSILSNVSAILTFISEILLIFVYIGLFRRYWPKHQTAASLLSIFGLFPIMVFIARKNKPINYQEYLRQRYNAMYGNPNMNNYYNGDNFNSNGYQNDGDANPFEDFESDKKKTKDIDPFDEFSDKK